MKLKQYQNEIQSILLLHQNYNSCFDSYTYDNWNYKPRNRKMYLIKSLNRIYTYLCEG